MSREDTAQFRLATLLAEHDDIHTVHHQMIVAGRVLAFLPRINSWVDTDQTAAPRPVLRQQQHQRYDDQDWLLERLREVRQEDAELVAALRSLDSPHVDLFDPDDREEDREDDRRAAALHDERAADAAPRGIGKAS